MTMKVTVTGETTRNAGTQLSITKLAQNSFRLQAGWGLGHKNAIKPDHFDREGSNDGYSFCKIYLGETSPFTGRLFLIF